jgi:triosephosphate isomerase
MNLPMIVVNFKTYTMVDGERSMDLAKICHKVSEDTGVNIVVCPPTVELSRIAREVPVPVFQ